MTEPTRVGTTPIPTDWEDDDAGVCKEPPKDKDKTSCDEQWLSPCGKPDTLNGVTYKDLATNMPKTAPDPYKGISDADLAKRADELKKKVSQPTSYADRDKDTAELGAIEKEQSRRVALAKQPPLPNSINPKPDDTGAAWTGWKKDADGNDTYGVFRSKDDGVQIGAVTIGKNHTSIDASAITAKGTVSRPDGSKLDFSGEVGGVHYGVRQTNADGSKSVDPPDQPLPILPTAVASVTGVGGEATYTSADGNSVTFGLSAGAGLERAIGTKVVDGAPKVCGRVSAGPITVGACVPDPRQP